nr:MAG: hypothetical protein AM325_01900 [Candidatus Thorarchaeota archaeon SMTZ1-45]
MARPVMFNGRLAKNELDTWLNLLNETSPSGYVDRSLANAFLQLPESISFASSIENKIIGGTSIYRDRTRLAMVLASVAVFKEFRESSGYQIVKSSLPFFKTVAIRDVDALVSLETKKNTLGFPLSLELDSWVTDIIRRIGFSENEHLEHYSFTIREGVREKSVQWVNVENEEQVRELIWNQSRQMGLVNSIVWLTRDFAAYRNCLVNIFDEERIKAVAGFWNLSNSLCVTPLLIDPDSISWREIADSLIVQASGRDVNQIELPLIGKGQLELIQELERRCDISSCRKLLLLRKSL